MSTTLFIVSRKWQTRNVMYGELTNSIIESPKGAHTSIHGVAVRKKLHDGFLRFLSLRGVHQLYQGLCRRCGAVGLVRRRCRRALRYRCYCPQLWGEGSSINTEGVSDSSLAYRNVVGDACHMLNGPTDLTPDWTSPNMPPSLPYFPHTPVGS